MDGIKLVISDVDGTLVTSQKRVTERTRQAVATLHERGIGFTVVSSRPVFGLRALIDSLHIDIPVAAFNGGAIAGPQLDVVERSRARRQDRRRDREVSRGAAVGIWLFTNEDWYTRDPNGAHVSHETITVQRRPVIASKFRRGDRPRDQDRRHQRRFRPARGGSKNRRRHLSRNRRRRRARKITTSTSWRRVSTKALLSKS